MSQWQSRIVGHGRVAPDQLVANPHNFRSHPPEQRQALKDAIAEVGFLRSVTVNRVTGNLVDGHERVWQALTSEQEFIDVEYVELTEDEEKKALLTLDPISEMARADAEKLGELMAMVNVESESLAAMLASLADKARLSLPVEVQAGVGVVEARATLAERFGVPPFSVLDARQGYWQERKRAWIALGIQSELGRGAGQQSNGESSDPDKLCPGGSPRPLDRKKNAQRKLAPGGSAMPAARLENGKTVRGDGRGRRLQE